MGETENISISLAAARVNSGLSQSAFAAKLGVHRTTVHNWETGKTSPDSNYLKKISVLTKIPLDYIFLPDTLLKVDDNSGISLRPDR